MMGRSFDTYIHGDLVFLVTAVEYLFPVRIDRDVFYHPRKAPLTALFYSRTPRPTTVCAFVIAVFRHMGRFFVFVLESAFTYATPTNTHAPLFEYILRYRFRYFENVWLIIGDYV